MVIQTLAGAGALTSPEPSAGSGLAIRGALIVVLLATASGLWWVTARRAARFRPQRRPLLQGHPSAPGALLTTADLAQELGTRGTFVQFSSATCASCPQVRRVLTKLAASEAGVIHVDLHAEDHMHLVRRFSVYRTPTVLLLDPQGAIHSRSSGPLTQARALDALDQLSHETTRSINV